MKALTYRSPLRRTLASITLVVGWYMAMQVSPWARNIQKFAEGIWSTNTASVEIADAVALIVVSGLCVVLASLVGYMSYMQAGISVLVLWSLPLALGFRLGVLLSGFGPGAGPTSDASQSAASGYFLGSPLYAGFLTWLINKWSTTTRGWSEVDSNKRPFYWFFYGPLLRTPQGLACALSCVATLAAATLYVAMPSSAPILGFRLVLLIWPIVVMAAFVALGYTNGFRPSFIHAALIGVVGAAPFVTPYLYAATA